MIEVSFANSIQLSWVIHHLAYAQLPHYHHYQILWSGRSNAVACAHPLNFILYFAIVCVVSFLVCVYRSHLQESGAYKSWELTTSSKTWIEAHCVQMRWRHRKVRNCGVSMVEPFLAARLKTWDFDFPYCKCYLISSSQILRGVTLSPLVACDSHARGLGRASSSSSILTRWIKQV
jgi:hypothetical protein